MIKTTRKPSLPCFATNDEFLKNVEKKDGEGEKQTLSLNPCDDVCWRVGAAGDFEPPKPENSLPSPYRS